MPARIHPKNRLWPALAGLLLCLLLASPANAVDYTWNGLAFPLIGIWGTASNWLPNGVPGTLAVDTIRFNANTNLNPGVNRTLDGIYASGANIDFRGGRNVQVSTIWALVSTNISHSEGGRLITNNGELRYEGAGAIAVNISSWLPSGNTTLFSSGTLTYSGAISGGTSLTTAGAGTTVLTGLNTYTGSTTVSAGTLTAIGAGNILPSATTLSLAGGTACNLADQTLARLSGSGTLNLSGDVNINEGGSQTFSGNITQGAASTLTMQGSGSLTLSGNVNPALAVSNGSLVLNGTSFNTINVTGGSMLLGTGGTTNLLTVTSGSLMPGNSIGTLGCNSLLMQPAGTLAIEVNGAAADQLAVTFAVTLNSPTLKVTGTPTIGASFKIIDKTNPNPITGTFSGLAEGATFDSDGYRYQITYAGGGGSNNDAVLTCLGLTPNPSPTPTPTPEPAPDTPPAPSVPQGSGPSPAGSLDGTAFSWPLVKGATHYRIYRAECPLCPRKEIGRVTDTSFVDNTAIAGQPYTYWLRAENGDGPGVYSNWMAAWRYEQNPGRAGDFNGDGVTDLLWWNRDTGQVYIWFLKDGQVIGVSAPMEGLDVSQWLLIGTGDFNGDGVADLLWWKPETGEILFWYMQPSMATAEAPFQAMLNPISQTMPAHAAIAYPGDLNGDGFTDILWRDYSNGDLTIWLMGADGKPILSGPPTPAFDDITKGERPGLSGGLQWQVAGLSDANGDGKADVIWQDERNNRLVTWLMDGAAIIGAVEENKGLDPVWRLPGVGDLNGDRQADIVWRNDASGEVKAWLMQAGVFSEERTMLEGSEDATQWQVKAVGDFRAPGCDDVYLKHSESSAVKLLTLDGREFTPVVQ
jgi:autotransporter-associated beta strand protein